MVDDCLNHKTGVHTGECILCFSEFTAADLLSVETSDKCRHSIHPCGHAAICGACAKQLWVTTKRCPLCRAEMTRKPKIFKPGRWQKDWFLNEEPEGSMEKNRKTYCSYIDRFRYRHLKLGCYSFCAEYLGEYTEYIAQDLWGESGRVLLPAISNKLHSAMCRSLCYLCAVPTADLLVQNFKVLSSFQEQSVPLRKLAWLI